LYTQTSSGLTKRWTDFGSLVLLFILFMLAVTRLEITHWATELGLAGWLMFIGAVLGYVVGSSRIRSGLSTLIIIAYSLLIIPGIALFEMTDEPTLLNRLTQLWERINQAGGQLLANQPVTDSILFILGMGLLYWLLGNMAGFALARKGNPWLPILILGGAMILIEHYQVGARKQFYTGAYAIFSLILLGRLYYLRIREGLKAENIKIGDESSFDFTRGVVIAALLIGLGGWIIPSVARAIFVPSEFPTELSQKWDNFSRNFEHLVFSLDQNAQTADAGAGSIMDLGTGQVLGLNEVLNIETSQSAPLNNQFYWRLRVYDTYGSNQWSDGPVFSEYFNPSEKLPAPTYKNLLPVQIRVTSSMSRISMLYVPGIPNVISKEVQATITTGGGGQADIFAVFTSPPILNGGAYRATAEVSTAGAVELSAAGTNYPQWILDRYMELPSDLPQSIRDLSQQVTDGKLTAYDKTVAITNYLRSNITYQTTIPAPPRGRDAIDWFLFDYKKGFCNYYASAEVLLLRAAGIPARMAVGYAQGVETSRQHYSVREKDSHAWPEVYFPGYGWIPFEPTSGIAAVDYTGAGGTGTASGSNNQVGTGETPNALPGLNGEERAQRLMDRLDNQLTDSTSSAAQLTLLGKILLGAAIALVLGLAIYLFFYFRKHGKDFASGVARGWKTFYRSITRIPLLGDLFLSMGLTSVERSYLAVERGLDWLGVRVPTGFTAAEVTELLIKELPKTEEDANALLATYEETIYGKKKSGHASGTLAALRINLAVAREYLRRIFLPVRRLNDRFS